MNESELKLLSARASSLITNKDKEALFSKLTKVAGKKVLAAMRVIPRERFMPIDHFELSYDDEAYPFKESNGRSSISQPSTVARMTQTLNVRKTDFVLEIGSASGYQAAVLGKLAKRVVSVEILPRMAKEANRRLHDLGINNVDFVTADGTWPFTGAGKFDRIMVTAAIFPHASALAFLNALKTGGICVAPIGGDAGNPEWCKLAKIRKTEDGFKIEKYKSGYSFVLAGGKEGWDVMARLVFNSFHRNFFKIKD